MTNKELRNREELSKRLSVIGGTLSTVAVALVIGSFEISRMVTSDATTGVGVLLTSVAVGCTLGYVGVTMLDNANKIRVRIKKAERRLSRI